MAGKGVQLGFLKYILGFDTLQFKKGISDADADLAKMQKRFAAKGKEFQQLGKSLTAFVTLPLAALAGAGIKEAQETAAAMAQVNSALASMGPVAGRSAAQLKTMSDALELKSLYEGDQILKEVTAKLLTFGRISGTVFDQAQQAAVDLATRFGTDLGSAAVLVGKALNDPIHGLTALRRVGVSFTEQQREQIKAMAEAGDVAGAQALILAELKREVGGAAAAAQNADPWNKLSDAFKSIAESIGTLLLPIIPPLANALASVAQWVTSLDPTTQKWVVGLGAVAVVLGPLLIVLGNVITAVSAMAPLVLALTKGWGLLTVGLTALAPVIGVIRVALLALLGNPVVLGAAVLITGIYLAWKHWDQIGPIVQRAYQAVKTWVADKMTGVLNAVLTPINAVTNAFRTMYDKVVGHSYVPDMVDEIGLQMDRLPGIMVQPAIDATEATGAAFGELAKRNPLQQWADSIPQTLPQITEAFQGIAAHGLDMMGDAIADVITGARSLKEAFGDVARSIISDLIRMAARMLIFRALSSIFPSLFGSGGAPGGPISIGGGTEKFFASNPFGGFRAGGGPVVPGRTYMVGENGPEFVNFGRRGYVSPANDAGPARIVVNQTFAPNFAGNAATKQDLIQMAVMTKTATLQAINENRRRGKRG